MKFGSSGTSDPMDDWMERSTILLPADHPHQRCCRETQATLKTDKPHYTCYCKPVPCTQECCKTPEDDWL